MTEREPDIETGTAPAAVVKSAGRVFEVLELFRRATSGRLAEILGDSYLDDDLIARRDYYTDAELITSVKAWLVDGGIPEADLR